MFSCLVISFNFYIILTSESPSNNQRGSESHLVNTEVYKAKFSLVDVSVNEKKVLLNDLCRKTRSNRRLG